MIAFALAVLIAQASPAASAAPAAAAVPATQPAPAASLSPDWIASPLHELEYARYTRLEIDGTKSVIVASRQVCDCQPDVGMKMLTSVLSQIHGVTNHEDQIVACGQPAQRNVATGLADAATKGKNLETVMFRSGGAFYTLTYTFRSDAPLPSAEAALLSLCGAAAKPAP